MKKFVVFGSLLSLGLGLLALRPVAADQAQAQKREAPAAQEPTAKPAAPEKPAPTPEEAERQIIRNQKPSYPLTTCLASGEPLDSMGKPFDAVIEGKLMRFCCQKCAGEAKKNPAEYAAKVDAAVVAAQLASYPLSLCPHCEKALSSVEKPVDHVHGTRLVRFCCDDCVKSFQKDPAPVMAKIDAALIAAQIPAYGMSTCFISSEALDVNGTPLDFLYGTELVRLCCGGCKRAFDKDPEAHMAKLHEAKSKAAPERSSPAQKKPETVPPARQ